MTNSNDIAALLLRLTLAALFLAHAWLKIFVFTPAGTSGFFESLGLPGIVAYLTIFAEVIGAIALIIGLQTRWVSLALTPILIGSIVFVHGANGWLFSAPNGGWEFPAFWAVALIVQALLGAGAYRMDITNGKLQYVGGVA
ncbi:DoxX family protein [Maritalea porphyrae]|uniref:Quinol oxidase n=1 Tax=Maritalea porphyrae TaxID=880732 RepID=A0ABQ5UT32_9HYPH|nr:DoxX family protein [Maritalea porphyrae]GLQ17890.1 quinol oxidase [Maritalea porphyrae]